MKTKTIGLILIALTTLSFSCGKGKDEVVVAQLNTEFSLKFEQTAEITNEKLSIKFQSINDSRCPAGTNCFWQGEGKISLMINNSTIDLSTLHQSKDTLGYTFSLIELSPYPDISETIKNEDYVLKMKVVK